MHLFNLDQELNNFREATERERERRSLKIVFLGILLEVVFEIIKIQNRLDDHSFLSDNTIE